MLAHRFDLASGLSIEVGFGERQDSLQSIRERIAHYPAQPQLLTLHQVHSDICVERTTVSESIGDAHWTQSIDFALAIKTADCLPVLGTIPTAEGGAILVAIHAGWRGVAANIIGKSLRQLGSSVSSLSSGEAGSLLFKHARFWVGPHIRMQSFKIQSDALNLLQTASREIALKADPFSADCRSLVVANSETEFQFNLLELAQHQLKMQGIEDSQIDCSFAFDTVSDLRFHSHRRDRAQAGRNTSWITICS